MTLSREDLIALGDYNGFIPINKFGANPVVSTTEEDIWLTGGSETLPTSGVSMFISCTDNTSGVGQIILVDGLDENWDIQTQTVVLAGTTKTAISGLWTRIHRAYQVSANPDPVGDVYIYENDTVVAGVPQTAAKIHAFIDFTNAAQQTEKGMYTVPRGYKALVHGFHAEMGDITSGAARSAKISLEVAELASGATVDNPSWSPRRRVATHNISNSANSDSTDFAVPLVFDQLTDIHARATATAASYLFAEFQFFLIPRTLILT